MNIYTIILFGVTRWQYNIYIYIYMHLFIYLSPLRCSPLAAGLLRKKPSAALHTSSRRLPSVSVCFPETALGHGLGVVKAYPFAKGAVVVAGDVVAEVEAGPSQLLEVQSPHSGEVAAILRKPGEVVRSGDALVEVHVSLAELARGWWRALHGGDDRT